MPIMMSAPWARVPVTGIRALLAQREALDDAHFAVNVGLLSGLGVTIDQLRAIAEQLIADALEPLGELTHVTT